ncbi:hypothetical protein EXIGLDRAFT_736154 [Exidia glandulosa HHB12029]|uniref:Uncharacterized protein n=1 Tax=Exidia glandulosa HHB12029 TaxID=1314781 RepID=A0A165JIZ0_EXIGL|nr:hypothetical protein EXIGLDRAFT_736154 [Exidia glandulosa HHB12029]
MHRSHHPRPIRRYTQPSAACVNAKIDDILIVMHPRYMMIVHGVVVYGREREGKQSTRPDCEICGTLSLSSDVRHVLNISREPV